MADEKKSGFSGRLLKFALWCVAGIFLFAVLLAVTLPLWISPVATSMAERVVPGYTGTPFRIDGFRMNPFSGTLRVNGVRLSNPEGFGDAAAFSLSNFSVEMVVGSLFSDTILVKEIVVEDAFASYYSHDGRNNFDVIMANFKKATEPTAEGRAAKDAEKKESSEKKVIIDRLRISGTKVKLMKSDLMPPFIMPPLDLTDIGRKSGGVTLKEAWTQIANGVMKSFTEAGEGLGALGGILGDGFKNIRGTAENSTGGLGNTVNDTVNAVDDTARKATEGVKNLLKGLGK